MICLNYCKNTNKIPLLVIVGPTASGKTNLSIKLAKEFNGEIISADSMQIYKGMDIATAKPDASEKDGVVHHLMDFLDVTEDFSVAQYCELAHKTIESIHNRGKLPILVGGTGLYIDSVVKNTVFADVETNEELRKKLSDECDEYGIDYLLDKLQKVDVVSYNKLSVERNKKRIIRALEVFESTSVPISQHNENSHPHESSYNVVKVGLKAEDRQYLYDRINRRVDKMLEDGLLKEAERFLFSDLSKTSAMAIGYKELLPYFEDTLTLDECIDNLKMQTRRYAKRQLTWFNRDKNTFWFCIDKLNIDEIFINAVDVVKKGLFYE